MNVKEIWFENGDLHVITMDNKHSIYEGAFLTDAKTEFDDGTVIEQNVVKFVVDKKGRLKP
jgi:hypothetical protein